MQPLLELFHTAHSSTDQNTAAKQQHYTEQLYLIPISGESGAAS